MLINTTLSELDETLYKYNELLGWAFGCEFAYDEETHLGVANYRIQIPSLDISLRPGDLMSQHGGGYESHYDPELGKQVETITPPPADAEWEVDASCVVICELNEKDMTKCLGWTTSDYQGAVHEYFYPKYKNYSDLNDVPCIIDTADFMEDEEKARKYAKECEEAYEEEMSEDDEDI